MKKTKRSTLFAKILIILHTMMGEKTLTRKKILVNNLIAFDARKEHDKKAFLETINRMTTINLSPAF